MRLGSEATVSDVVRVARRLCDFYGLQSPEELTGLPVARIVDDLAMPRELWLAAVRLTGARRRFTFGEVARRIAERENAAPAGGGSARHRPGAGEGGTP